MVREIRQIAFAIAILAVGGGRAAEITTAGRPARLDIRAAGDYSVRITLKPLDFPQQFPYSPTLVERSWPAPSLSLQEIIEPVTKRVGGLRVTAHPRPLTILIADRSGRTITDLGST